MGDIRKRFLPQKLSHIWVLQSAFRSAFVGCFPKYEICPHLLFSSSSSFLLPVTVRFSHSWRRSCSCSFVSSSIIYSRTTTNTPFSDDVLPPCFFRHNIQLAPSWLPAPANNLHRDTSRCKHHYHLSFEFLLVFS